MGFDCASIQRADVPIPSSTRQVPWQAAHDRSLGNGQSRISLGEARERGEERGEGARDITNTNKRVGRTTCSEAESVEMCPVGGHMLERDLHRIPGTPTSGNCCTAKNQETPAQRSPHHEWCITTVILRDV